MAALFIAKGFAHSAIHSKYDLDLNAAQAKALKADIIANIAAMPEWGQTYADFWGLVAYHNIHTEKLAEAALAAGIFSPDSLYRDASPTVRDQLLVLLQDPTCEEPNKVMSKCRGPSSIFSKIPYLL